MQLLSQNDVAAPRVLANEIGTRSDTFSFAGLVTGAEERTTHTGKKLVEITIIDPPLKATSERGAEVKVTIWETSKHNFSYVMSDLPRNVLAISNGGAVTVPMIMVIGEAKSKLTEVGSINIQLWGNRSKVRFVAFNDYLLE
jgi:hypothetical protein